MCLQLAPPTQANEIIGKWFFVGQATRRFLLDSDRKLTHTELNCLKLHQPGYSGYIESIRDHFDPDITVFLIHDITGMLSDASYADSGKWFFKNYHQIETFFELVKKIDRKSLL